MKAPLRMGFPFPFSYPSLSFDFLSHLPFPFPCPLIFLPLLNCLPFLFLGTSFPIFSPQIPVHNAVVVQYAKYNYGMAYLSPNTPSSFPFPFPLLGLYPILSLRVWTPLSPLLNLGGLAFLMQISA